ncbi:unnamed protein product [Amoebophrya sp. A120]|nr:unnamed protein product [Amoebophrya sp. A120]|eukprot:GSA120T00011666001.1
MDNFRYPLARWSHRLVLIMFCLGTIQLVAAIDRNTIAAGAAASAKEHRALEALSNGAAATRSLRAAKNRELKQAPLTGTGNGAMQSASVVAGGGATPTAAGANTNTIMQSSGVTGGGGAASSDTSTTDEEGTACGAMQCGCCNFWILWSVIAFVGLSIIGMIVVNCCFNKPVPAPAQ